MQYTIQYKKSVEKDLRGLPKDALLKIIQLIDTLKEKPRPDGVKKLRGFDKMYRIRSGHYRVIYTISDTQIVIVIVKIGHRKDIYK